MSFGHNSTKWAAVTLAVLVIGVLLALWLAIPWGAGAPGSRGELSPSADFTAAQQHREEGFYRQLRPWSLTGLGLGLVVTVVLGLTPLGARIIGTVAQPFGGSWPVTAILGGLALGLIGQLAVLPMHVMAERVQRRYGLSTQDWGSWTLDSLKAMGIGAVITCITGVAFYGLVRAAPRWWWAPMSLLAAGMVFALSFLYPVLIEPVFNKFTPMAPGELRDDLLAMARSDGVPVQDVLVADASRRTTALNAYVSGYGASRRIVVYDTLLRDTPDAEIKLVVAHELGHAKSNDVLIGTGLGAAAAAIAVVTGYLLLTSGWLLRRAGVTELADPRSLALVLALLAIAGFLTAPVQSLISRRIEARADQHSLEVTDDPATFIKMHRRLASSNLSDLQPNPVLYFMFASHPATVLRLGHARDFARTYGVTLDPTLRGDSTQ